jgi:RNA-binding protein
MSAPRRGRSGAGDAPRTGEGGAPAGERTPKKKAGGARRPRVKARFDKKSGDVRSKPGTRADGSPKNKGGPVTGAGIRHLRGLGHHLEPVVQIGKDGITDALIAATNEALRTHELIKVKVGSECPVDRKEAGPELATKTGATLAQVLGRTLLLYKRHPSKPKIDLPR